MTGDTPPRSVCEHRSLSPCTGGTMAILELDTLVLLDLRLLRTAGTVLTAVAQCQHAPRATPRGHIGHRRGGFNRYFGMNTT